MSLQHVNLSPIGSCKRVLRVFPDGPLVRMLQQKKKKKKRERERERLDPLQFLGSLKIYVSENARKRFSPT